MLLSLVQNNRVIVLDGGVELWYYPSMKDSKKPRNPDHVRRFNRPGVGDEIIEERIQSLVQPAVLSLMDYYRSLGMRSRILSLPVMTAAVLSLLWRQIPSTYELARCLAREPLLWLDKPIQVSERALSKRFLEFPAELFQRVYLELLPRLRERCEQRQRPRPASIEWVKKHFNRILAADCSTLEALFRKLDSLEEAKEGQLAGKICTIIDLTTRLPEECFFMEEAGASDFNFTGAIVEFARAGDLLIFDRGFHDYGYLDKLMDKGAHFITRTKSNDAFTIKEILGVTADSRDYLVVMGSKQSQYGQCLHEMRMVDVRFGKTWYRYLTSVMDCDVLPAKVLADLYRRRWRIEEAFLTAKRLLGLSYLWTGSVNGVLLQGWSTWLFYSLLIDLADSVADTLGVPLDDVSLEMTFRGLYHFIQARSRGLTTDPVQYLSDTRNNDLGILKRKDKRRKPALVLA